MASPSFRFDRFVLDPADRRLSRDDAPVELNGRYFDALALLVSEQGRLVSKDRFLDQVWRGVPVTDEALTQCIKTLRRQLGDDASRPRFIETVPKHGYRFIATVEVVRECERAAERASSNRWRNAILLAGAGTVGGGLAGLIGGLIYGFAGASQPLQPGIGAVSVLLVLICITELVALIGAAGVAFGIAAAGAVSGSRSLWPVAGGAAGGLVVGALVKLIGLDAFGLLVGRAPGDITGAGEGALLGAAVGLAAWIANRFHRPALRRSLAAGAVLGGLAGAVIVLLGGHLMAGSLDQLAREFPDSRLRLDQLGALFGETGLGPVTQVATGALEGALFGACVVGAMTIARKSLAVTR